VIEQSKNIDITYRSSLNNMEIIEHLHNSHEIIYILEGTALFQINNKNYECKSGDLIFISNLESHNVRISTYPYKRYFLLIDPQYFQTVMKDPLLTSILKHRPGHFNHVISVDESHKSIFIEFLKNMDSENKLNYAYSQYKMECYLQIFLIELFRNYKDSFPLSHVNKSMSTVLEIQKYIDEHYKEEVNLQNISKMFYINMYYLSHQFKEITGFSFKEYLILQRISRSKHLLFHTSHDITTVASESGFNNVNHYIRIFKKFESVTPYQYRKKFSMN
jgi:YesN/AraC family two-component response regulator